MMEPSQNLEQLGFILNSKNMSRRQRYNIIHLLTSSLSNSLTIRDIAQITGTLVTTFPTVEYGRLFYRELEMLKTQSLKCSYNFDISVFLNSACIAEIHWWRKEGLFRLMSFLIKIQTISYKVTVQGLLGGGLLLDHDRSTQWFWNSNEKEHNINILELKASKLGVQALCQDLNQCHLQLQIDNTTAVANINNMGGGHTPQM